MPFSNNYQEALKKNKGLSLARPGNYIEHLGPHGEVATRKRENAGVWGSAFFGVKGGGLGFSGLLFIW